MAIGLMMTAVIVTVFAQSSQSSKVNQARNEIQEQARVALDMLQRDLRQAGYIGCNSNRLLNSGGLVNTTSTPNSYRNNLAAFMQGYEGTGASFTPAAPAADHGRNAQRPRPSTTRSPCAFLRGSRCPSTAPWPRARQSSRCFRRPGSPPAPRAQ